MNNNTSYTKVNVEYRIFFTILFHLTTHKISCAKVFKVGTCLKHVKKIRQSMVTVDVVFLQQREIILIAMPSESGSPALRQGLAVKFSMSLQIGTHRSLLQFSPSLVERGCR